MPFLFLSPSTQTYNPYVTTGNEQYWMNRLADRVEPYLHASGINVTRNDPNGSAALSIRASNASYQDFHLALHYNAAPQALAGQLRGVDVYYYPGSESGLRMASILVDNFRSVYPDPDRVQARSTTRIGELRQTNAPSVLCEIGYHDNREDADWLTGNLEQVAAAAALSVTEYFGVPFLTPGPVLRKTVQTTSGALNLRSMPSLDGAILRKLASGTDVNVWGSSGEWDSVESDGLFGYAASRYLRPET